MDLFAFGLMAAGLLLWILTGKWYWGIIPLVIGIAVGLVDQFV